MVTAHRVSAAPAVVRPGPAARSIGRPLPDGVRVSMEARFSTDFGSVRVHSDDRAARTAERLGALAYTVGSDVYFARGAFAPATRDGSRLLAHELTHVVQQREACSAGPLDATGPEDPSESEAGSIAEQFGSHTEAGLLGPVRRPLARRTLQRQTVRMASGRLVGDTAGPDDNLQEEVVLAMDRLHTLWSLPNPDWTAEYPVVTGAARGSNIPKSSIPKTIGAIMRNQVASMSPPVAMFALGLGISGNVGAGEANAQSDILWLQDYLYRAWLLSNADYTTERGNVTGSATATVADALIPQTIAGIARLKEAIVAGNFLPHVLRVELSAGTHAVTPAEHAGVEATLHPGATVVTPPPVVGLPPPPPVVVPAPAMTGLPALGAPTGPFETAMKARLNSYVGGMAGPFRTLKATSGQPALPLPAATPIANAAQGEVEAHFGSYIQVASRAPSDVYHPRAYSLASEIHDQSAVPITDVGTADRPGRIGWVKYWMKQGDGGGALVMTTYHCDPTRSPDDAEFVRVSHAYATDPANRTDIDDAIHSYPAEQSAGVNIQPYQVMATPLQARQVRWDLFTVLLHEFMHVLEHPNHVRARTIIGGDAFEILKEGMADVMRRDLWDPPGNLKARLATPTMAPVRAQVEGASLPYSAAAISYHRDYPVMYPKAKSIVYGGGPSPGVGIRNAKMAFFMGHVELLGIGAGTATTGGASLAGVGMYRTDESAEAEIYVTLPGDTEATVRIKTNAPAGRIFDAAGAAVATGAGFTTGTRLRIPGIVWIYPIREDTLGSIANQHAISLQELARANGLPPLTPETYKFPAGTRVLIPIHVVRP